MGTNPDPKLTGLWISAYPAGGAVSGRPPTPSARVPGPQRKGPTGGWVERGRRGLITATGPAGPATHPTGYFRIGVNEVACGSPAPATDKGGTCHEETCSSDRAGRPHRPFRSPWPRAD